MRIVQFSRKNDAGKTLRPGVQVGGEHGDIVDVHALLGAQSTIDLIKSANLKDLQSTVDNCSSRIALGDVELGAPITKPDKVLCIGMNYKDHCLEQGVPPPDEPVVFNKFPSTIVGPCSDVPLPEVTSELDWEVELAVVIGKEAKNVPKEKAMDHVFGFTAAHDVSARDWQLKRNGGQWLVGKSMEAFCPLGPAIVTKDELLDPHDLDLKCIVNGVTKQDSNTSQLIFKTEDVVAWCSRLFTLLPGDVILTGTPPGVGVFRKPQEFLKKGDEVQCWIQGIGTIRNRVV